MSPPTGDASTLAPGGAAGSQDVSDHNSLRRSSLLRSDAVQRPGIQALGIGTFYVAIVAYFWVSAPVFGTSSNFRNIIDNSAGLEALERAGVRIERHPAAKDATDVELALDAAMAFGPRRIVLVGDAGGRLDHLLGLLYLLGADAYAAVEVDAILGPATIHVVRRERLLVGEAGELVSLLALHGPAGGVVTEGLVYPLRGETLAAGSSRGLSLSEFVSDATRRSRMVTTPCPLVSKKVLFCRDV